MLAPPPPIDKETPQCAPPKKTNITNITVVNNHYSNMRAPGAVTAMPQASFASGRVKNAVIMTRAQVANIRPAQAKAAPKPVEPAARPAEPAARPPAKPNQPAAKPVAKPVPEKTSTESKTKKKDEKSTKEP